METIKLVFTLACIIIIIAMLEYIILKFIDNNFKVKNLRFLYIRINAPLISESVDMILRIVLYPLYSFYQFTQWLKK